MEGPNLFNQEKSRNVSEIDLKEVVITPDQPLTFEVEATKKPIEIHSGDSVGGNAIEVKIEGAVEALMKDAEKLKEFPENERLGLLLDLVRTKLTYPYSEVIEDAKKTNPKLAEWLELRFGESPKFLNTEINEYLEKGYGDCKIMAVAYLLAAQSAGLKGIYSTNMLPIKNLERPDNKKPIFKSIEIEQDMGSHAWVEIQLENGDWIPVDISANIIGVGQMLELLKNAGYNTPVSFVEEGVPKELYMKRSSDVFGPGEPKTNTTITLQIKKISGQDSQLQMNFLEIYISNYIPVRKIRVFL